MRISFAIGALSAVVLLAGCASDRIDDMDAGVRPQPLEAQPVAPVESNALPDPTTDTAQFPDKPVVDPALAQNQTDTAAAATALDVTKAQMVGNWKVASSGVNCQMFLTLTNLGSGSRGGTKGCGNELSMMNSWEVAGKQVVAKDRDGNVLARFYKSAENRFDGSTNGGQPVSLSR